MDMFYRGYILKKELLNWMYSIALKQIFRYNIPKHPKIVPLCVPPEGFEEMTKICLL